MQTKVLITGANGLVGSESALFFSRKGYGVIGIDNDMRASFFGGDASTKWMGSVLSEQIPGYISYEIDIRDSTKLRNVFDSHGSEISLIIHAAAQPSHDWAARNPQTDFSVNANGTLNLLELTRQFCPDAAFIFTSTNKVYGDTPNQLPLVELDSRWEIHPDHPFQAGIDESMSIDQSTHSIFGASKVSADILVQEYGRYFGLKTAVFRGGCLTGPNHTGAELHGFLSYLVKCAIDGIPYTIFGYEGKQVRDHIHSFDLVNMFWHFVQSPRSGVVYNAGGGRGSNCSVLEAIQMVETSSGRKINWTLSGEHRVGDHKWYISDVTRFRQDYPGWEQSYSLEKIIKEMITAQSDRPLPNRLHS